MCNHLSADSITYLLNYGMILTNNRVAKSKSTTISMHKTNVTIIQWLYRTGEMAVQKHSILSFCTNMRQMRVLLIKVCILVGCYLHLTCKLVQKGEYANCFSVLSRAKSIFRSMNSYTSHTSCWCCTRKYRMLNCNHADSLHNITFISV